ncbi:MAG: tyrosine--tRNA ligase [Halobacteriota archaeon]
MKIEQVKKNVDEVVTENELAVLLDAETKISAYAGYEPSGQLHLGHLLTAYKLKELQSSGVDVIVLLADLHAYLNEKGTMDQISKWARYYKKCFTALGLAKETKFVLGSDYQLEPDYTKLILRLARHTTLNRARRSMDEVSRNAEDPIVSQMIYPLMQAADIGYLKIDIAVGGIDQRKIHMLARETLHSMGFPSPVCIHMPILLGLDANKMSSSKNNLIAMEDSSESIKKKIGAAYCPARTTEGNPILQLYRYFIFPRFKRVGLERPKRFGGLIEYEDFSRLEMDYAAGKLHPLDLKNGAASYTDQIVSPIRAALFND